MKLHTRTGALWTLAATLSSSVALSQGLAPREIYAPLAQEWPTYAGDYTGRHFSSLAQINRQNVKSLSLAWVERLPVGHDPADTVVGGEVANAVPFGGPGADGARVAGSILEVHGVLYVSAPDHAWAVDARSGRVIWHYFWKSKGGTHIGNRGMAMHGNVVYLEVPDDYVIALDATTGKELWHTEVSDFNQQYFSTMAPVVVDDHLLVGTGNDMDAPGYLESLDPQTGKVQWKWWSTPHDKGDLGADTWPNEESARYGGGNVWIPGAFDPQTRLYYFGTGNPNPVESAGSRLGDNLFTASLIALNVDTGRMAWYYQTTPHDTHDMDAAQTPILIDAPFAGKPRKLLLNGNRNGYFFVLDRLTGEHLLTSKFSTGANWSSGVNAQGQPLGDRGKDASVGGSLVFPSNPGIANWMPAAYSPHTGLFYLQSNDSYSEYYLTDTDPRNAQGFGGVREDMLGSLGRSLMAIDYRTGKIAWQIDYPLSLAVGGGVPGLLATAGDLVFGADAAGNLVARDAANGRPLWHTLLGNVSNAPETYELDGRQYLLIAVTDTLYGFALN
jgi:alcohol dehydrogenase (cytochrome c)